jgi:hypothetical protein
MKTPTNSLFPLGALLSLVLLSGCAAGTPTSSVPTELPPTPTGAATITSAPVPTNTQPPEATTAPTTSPAPTTEPSPAVGQALALNKLHMLTASEGWATGMLVPAGGSPPPFGGQNVYRTFDGGAHWQDATPPGISTGPFTTAYFLDASHAWIAAGPPPSGESGPVSTTFTVFRSQDGGQTWEPSEPVAISGGGPGVFSFPDPQHGWIMASLGAAMSHEAVAVFRTTDGGMHWEQVSLTSGMQGESTPGSLPFVCDKTGFAFSDASTGWAGGACPGAELFFYVSHDGGGTWEAVMPPPPAGYAADIFSHCQCVVSQPTFLSPQIGFVSIQIYEAQEGATLYVTEDGGVTWAPRPLPATQLLAGGPDFVDAATGWLADGQQLYVTHDAGTTWDAVGALPFSGQDLSGMDFVDASHGWLLGQGLYVTDDGGHSWSAISPVVTGP